MTEFFAFTNDELVLRKERMSGWSQRVAGDMLTISKC